MAIAFVYSDEFSSYDYGAQHPLKTIRLKLTYELIKAYGLLDVPEVIFAGAEKADGEEIAYFHTPKYIEIIRRANLWSDSWELYQYGLGPGDNPLFEGMYEWSALVVGATLRCAKLIEEGRCNIAFNISGGLHHALPERASGFCYFNDPAVAIKYLISKGFRVAYVDIDAHHGDGVQAAFYDTDKVLTISIHQDGQTLFPGTGYGSEIGEGPGAGYSVNVPLAPGSDDEIFYYAFEEVVPPLLKAFRPDITVTQLGVDGFRTDPLSSLNFTTNGFKSAVRRIKDITSEINSKWLALGGGGYNLSNVPRAWAIAWDIMIGVGPPDELPSSYVEMVKEMGLNEELLNDPPFKLTGPAAEIARRSAMRSIEYIKRNIFPVHGLK